MIKDIKRISFSELKNWKECPYRHKLIYIDKLPYYSGNEYTAFGTAIHEVCEKILLDETLKKNR
jgi:ATP-dependent helicase/DNAse subunit B